MPSYKNPPRRHEPYKWTLSESLQVTLAYIKPSAASPSHQGTSCRHRGPDQSLLLGSLEDLSIPNPFRCRVMLYAGVMRQLFMTRPTWHQSVLIHLDLPSTQLCMHDNGLGGWTFDWTKFFSGSTRSLHFPHTPAPSIPRSLPGSKSHSRKARELLTCHVRQASLWPWQQHKPHKPTTSEQRKWSSSQPQQHIFSHHL